MRARMYDFLWIIISAPLVLLWMATGGSGFLLGAYILAVVLLRAFVFVLQVANYSDKIVTDSLSNSTDGKFFDRCDPIGEVIIHMDNPKTPEHPTPLKAAAYPAVRFYEPGTGEWGLAKKWGGNEHGFLIVAEEIAIQLSDSGSVVCFGPSVTLRPIHHGVLQLLRQVKPTETDMRKILPPEWWEKLRAHPRFNVKKSAVHLILDPLYPVIKADRLGNPILLLPGADAVPGKHGPIPPLRFNLSDVVGKDSPLFDLRPEMRRIRDGELEMLRAVMGKKVDTLMEINQFLREEIEALTAHVETITPQEMFKEKVVTAVAGQEQTGERGR